MKDFDDNAWNFFQPRRGCPSRELHSFSAGYVQMNSLIYYTRLFGQLYLGVMPDIVRFWNYFIESNRNEVIKVNVYVYEISVSSMESARYIGFFSIRWAGF